MTDITVDYIIYILIGILVVILLYYLLTYKTAEEKEYNKKLKESLEDDYIIDPETGTKITLEEAESGIWEVEDGIGDEFSVMPDDELNKLPQEEARIAQKAVNYLKSSKFFRQYELSNEEFEILENTKILGGYDDWSFSHPFKFDNGFLILPAGKLNNTTYSESYILIWVKISNINGHYLFKEKTNVERFFDRFRKDDEIELENYECLTVKPSHNKTHIKSILSRIIKHNGLEIEIHNDNLFIQTLRLVNVDDIKMLEAIIRDL